MDVPATLSRVGQTIKNITPKTLKLVQNIKSDTLKKNVWSPACTKSPAMYTFLLSLMTAHDVTK